MKKRVVAVAAVLTIGALTSCAGHPRAAALPGLESSAAPMTGQVYSVDGPQFDSVDALTQVSDAVVEGTFTRHIDDVDEADLIDNAPTGAVGLPLELWEVKVTSVIKGNVPKTIVVTQIAANVEGAVRTAKPDRHSMLFLRAYAPGGNTYAVTGLGAGSFEVTGSKVAAPAGVSAKLAADVASSDVLSVEGRVQASR